jgi:SulP family sulfate permease
VVDASHEVQPAPTVSWEKSLDKPWMPEESNAAIAEETPEVIAEKMMDEPIVKIEEK